ncbi:MAG: D-alanyl-D-alanine carboxypeptidase, partial [Burkholderiales bacterium]
MGWATRRVKAAASTLAATVAIAAALAAVPLVAAAQSTSLPPAVLTELVRARVPADSLVALVVPVVPVAPRGAARLAWRVDAPVNPASIMKLVTTFSALELLGPAYTWRTGVYLGGPVEGGTLRGNLYIKGTGDPKLVVERLWLLLRRVQGLGIRAIAGDIVLDRGAFRAPAADPASFDNEPHRPYNAAPDALLVNFKSLALGFVPDVAANVARINLEPPFAGVELPAAVALSAGPCRDWRAGLKADFSDPARIRLDGAFPVACGEKSWAVAPP